MSESFDAELRNELLASDSPVAFDAEAFADRVVAAGQSRRKRRQFLACGGLAVMSAALLSWHHWPAKQVRRSNPQTPLIIADDHSELVDSDQASHPRHGSDDAAVAAKLELIEQRLAELERAQRRFHELSEQLARSQAALETVTRARQEQSLELLRAELSREISVPELDLIRF